MVLQQRLVAAPSVGDPSWAPDTSDPERYTMLVKPLAALHLKANGSPVQFPQKVWTCIKDYAEADELAVTTDDVPDGSSASGMRCKNKHIKQRNGRYGVEVWLDQCFDTPCPPSYSIKLNRGRVFRPFDTRGNRGLPHQVRQSNWINEFRNPYYSG